MSWLTLSIPLCQIGSKLHSSWIPWSIFVTQKCRSFCSRSAEWHYAHLGGNRYVNSALFWQCCLFSYQKARARVGLNSYQRVPFHDQTWTPMRDGSDMSLDESSPPTSEDSDEEHIPTLSSLSEKQNFRSGWRTASAPDYKLKRPPVQFTEHTGCTQDCSKFSPVQIFQLYICQAVWELMVEETNRYAAQTLSADTAWLRQMFPKWWHSSHYFYPWASTKDLDTACIGPRPTSCEVPCIRWPWLAIDLRQSFDFCTSPTTKLKTNSPLTNFSKFVLYWTLYCHPFFGSISLDETSHRTRLW